MSRILGFRELFAEPSAEASPAIAAIADGLRAEEMRYIISGTKIDIDRIAEALEPLESSESVFLWADKGKELPLGPEEVIERRNYLLQVPRWEITEELSELANGTIAAESHIELIGIVGSKAILYRTVGEMTRLLLRTLAFRGDIRLSKKPILDVFLNGMVLDWDGRPSFDAALQVLELELLVQRVNGNHVLFEQAA